MNTKYLKFFIKAKEFKEKNLNIIEELSREFPKELSREQIIEISYNFQAGDYIKHYEKNVDLVSLYTDEMVMILKENAKKINLNISSVLDIGCGELTTLSSLSEKMQSDINYFCFDLSYPRVLKGVNFFKENSSQPNIRLNPFISEINSIPLPSNSIDIVFSNHAIEPNFNKEEELIKEIYRVAKHFVVLFEPSYANACDIGKKRMIKHGYAQQIDTTVKSLSSDFIDIKPMLSNRNKYNPTYSFTMLKNKIVDKNYSEKISYTIPGSDYKLIKDNNWYVSEELNIIFPILKEIPILRLDKSLMI